MKAVGSDSSSVGGRPGWTVLIAAGAVVLVVGGFALSRDYGVQSIPPPSDLEEIATPTTSGTTSSTMTTVPVWGPATDQSSSIVYSDWMYEVSDIDVSPDGLVYVASGAGVASLNGAGEWVLFDIEGLPTGTGLDDRLPGRVITQVAAGPDGTVWVAGHATSHADDEEFGGIIDGWIGGRILYWAARYHCPLCEEWTVWTTNRVPELKDGFGDLVVVGDGTVFGSVGENLLMVFNGQQWTSIEVPLSGSSSSWSPWSGSLAVGNDGVVWAATWEQGLFAFDGSGFTRYTTEDGLPSNHTFQVEAAVDGTVWVATDVLYASVETASSDEAAGIASFDGTTWTTYTMEDGLLSNDAVVAIGADGTVWAVHSEIPPYGFSRFDGTGWTTYPSDSPVGGWRTEVAPDGTLWTISDEGLVSFDGTTRTVHPSPFVHPDGSFWLAPDRWQFPLDDADWGPGVYTIFMEVDARPLTANNVDDVSGRLIWDETVVDLCGIGFDRGNGFLQIGDTFQTSEGCGTNPTAMQDAFNEFGPPETACLTVTVCGLDHEYCAPLPASDDVSVGSGRGAIRVSLDGLEGLEGLAVDAWVVQIDPTDEWPRLGGVRFGPISEEPFSASEVIHPQSENYHSVDPSKVAMFEPGVYRFIIEAYVPSGNMHFGCEMPIQVVEGQPYLVTFTSLPAYTDSGIHWTPLDELRYPDCP